MLSVLILTVAFSIVVIMKDRRVKMALVGEGQVGVKASKSGVMRR